MENGKNKTKVFRMVVHNLKTLLSVLVKSHIAATICSIDIFENNQTAVSLGSPLEKDITRVKCDIKVKL